jgi:hypothetical protein
MLPGRGAIVENNILRRRQAFEFSHSLDPKRKLTTGAVVIYPRKATSRSNSQQVPRTTHRDNWLSRCSLCTRHLTRQTSAPRSDWRRALHIALATAGRHRSVLFSQQTIPSSGKSGACRRGISENLSLGQAGRPRNSSQPILPPSP